MYSIQTANKVAKFTFKTEKSKGRYASFYPDTHHIKLNKQEVGDISDHAPHKITLMVVDKTQKCGWRNITLKKESESVAEAKEWINNAFAAITEKWEIFQEKK